MPIFVNDGKSPLDAIAPPAPVVIPTPDSWGSNTEILAATKTLTNASETLQFLDPDGTDRDVELPAPGATNPFFLIYNTDETAKLILKQGATALAEVFPGTIAWMFSNGTAWISNSFSATQLGLSAQLMFFGADLVSNGQFLRANGCPHTSAQVSSNSSTTVQMVVVQAGFLSKLVWNAETAQPNGSFEVFRNETESLGVVQTVGAIRGTHTFQFPVQLAVGDRLSVTTGNTSVFDRTQVILVCSHGLPSNTLVFGNDGDTTDYWLAGGEANTPGDITLNHEKEMMILGSCTLDRIGLLSGNDLTAGTRTLEIYKNTVLQETITLTGGVFANGDTHVVKDAVGTTTFVEGDRIAVKSGGSGNILSNATLTLYFTGLPGHIYQWGGSTNGANGWHYVNQTANPVTAGLPHASEIHDAMMVFNGTAVKI